MQRPSPRFRSEEYFVYEISEGMLLIEVCMDAMLVPIQMGTNMATGKQQKHLSPSFATKAWTYPSRNS